MTPAEFRVQQGWDPHPMQRSSRWACTQELQQAPRSTGPHRVHWATWKSFQNLQEFNHFFFFFSRLLSTLKLLQNHGISQFSATLSLAVISVSLVQAQFQFKKYSNGCSNTCKNNCLSQLSAEISTISSQGLQWLKKACFKSVWGGQECDLNNNVSELRPKTNQGNGTVSDLVKQHPPWNILF